MVNPFQKVFNLLCLESSEESLSKATTDLQDVYFKSLDLNIKLLLDPWATKGILY